MQSLHVLRPCHLHRTLILQGRSVLEKRLRVLKIRLALRLMSTFLWARPEGFQNADQATCVDNVDYEIQALKEFVCGLYIASS